MSKTRLEAFSDGVIAIIITIMVLELKPPHGEDWAALAAAVPGLLSYLLSFIYLGIYWNNHHHLFHATDRVNGRIMWANLHLLFWLSLIPFGTAWMGENHYGPLPSALYGVVLLLAAVAYTILQTAIIADQGPGGPLALAVKRDVKGKLSVALYLLGIPLAFVDRWIANGLYIVVALIWLVPDRRIESTLTPER